MAKKEQILVPSPDIGKFYFLKNSKPTAAKPAVHSAPWQQLCATWRQHGFHVSAYSLADSTSGKGAIRHLAFTLWHYQLFQP
jgi:hypothetical protein